MAAQAVAAAVQHQAVEGVVPGQPMPVPVSHQVPVSAQMSSTVAVANAAAAAEAMQAQQAHQNAGTVVRTGDDSREEVIIGGNKVSSSNSDKYRRRQQLAPVKPSNLPSVQKLHNMSNVCSCYQQPPEKCQWAINNGL